ncbi:MAG: hypothetical protein HY738_00410 [Bacteroidia bacterium]|nr:hypothetical protein [Bacteroidia bacterium]
MKNLTSITSIDPENVYTTKGSRPVLVLCNDFNFYVCKYNTSKGTANKLFNEYIAASFLKLWNIKVPDFVFVKVKKEHIIPQLNLQPYYFDCTCFGSLHSKKYKEVDKFLNEMDYQQKKKYINKTDFLKIALFDIWISNEDRNYNNYNLMIDVENNNQFVPIDHETVFNTGNLHHGLVEITIDDTLINTPLLTRLFNIKELTNQDFFNELENMYYLCIENCNNQLNKILKYVPVDWLIDKSITNKLLQQYLFNTDWIKTCYHTFLEYLQLTLNRK